MSTSALSTTHSAKSADKYINSPHLQQGGDDNVVVPRSSLLRSTYASPVPHGQLEQRMENKHYLSKPGPKHQVVRKGRKSTFSRNSSNTSFIKTALKRTGTLLKERKDLELQSKEFDAKYVSVDTKGVSAGPFVDKLKLKDMEIDEMKNLVRSEFKGMNVAIRLVVVRSVNNTSSGTNVSVQTLDPAFSGEFASCAALFEMVRVLKVKIAHHPTSLVLQAPTGTTSTTNIVGTGWISVDTVQNTAMATPSDALDSSNHAEYKIAIKDSTDKGFLQLCKGCELIYIPPRPLVVSGGTTVLPDGGWCSTVGTPGIVCITGYLKWVETNSYTATTAQCGIESEHYDCEFRMRD